MKTKIMMLCSLLFILAACSGDSEQGYKSDKPVTSNDDWKPVVQEFDGVKMVLVPVGCFEMGDVGEGGRQCFDEPFWIDRYEVTNAQYRLCVEDGDCSIPISSTTQYDDPDYANHPANYIDWFQANDYAAWRGEEYRLPSEAQWEYAARGPDNLFFPWGNDFNHNYVVFSGNSSGTAPVGSKPGGLSWVGAYDVSGNVWEWTSTLYRDYPYDADDGRENQEDRFNYRLSRGGSFYYAADLLSTSSRFKSYPNFWRPNVGFRLARSYSDGEQD